MRGGEFECPKCGRQWRDDHNVTTCPGCGGFGHPESGCTCKLFTLGFGIRVNLIKTKDPTCPVHGELIIEPTD